MTVAERRAALLSAVASERERQADLPGREWDIRNGPNDWIAIAARYLGEEARRAGHVPSRDAYEASLIKAAAVILAALEHGEVMQREGRLA